MMLLWLFKPCRPTSCCFPAAIHHISCDLSSCSRWKAIQAKGC